MNVNETVPSFGRGRGSRGRQLKHVPIQKPLMGPPTRPAPKRSSSSAHTTTSSSNINWKSNQKSTQNNSTTVRTTSSSSRSHSSTEPESRVVIALCEGRGEAVGEVGIAAINIARPSLILCQISDSQSYINTLTKINILNPSEILIPLTFIVSNRLIEKVKQQFSEVKITGVTRSTFNKTTGLQYVKQLCVPSMNSILLILHHRYYALAAAAALLTYTETVLYVTYAWESIQIEYQESEGSTIIDVATADRLELVASARPTIKKRFSCLLDVLNHCVTKIGSRTLRASILQPPCFVPDIEARLNCVTELLEYSDMQKAIEAVLSNVTNIDQLLTLATVLPAQAESCSERQLNYILLLNTVLEQITPLQDIFENSTQPFFIELVKTLSNPAFIEIKDLVRAIINTDARPGKGESGIFQRCFAIKSGINSLLDLVRKSYSERIEDMRNYVANFGEEHALAFILHNNNKKGYHIVLNLNAHQKKVLKKTDLPPECIQVERLTNSYTMKTQYLINLSHRIEDIMAEILKMSNIMIHKLLIQIRTHIGIFYKLCEDIAKLDMIQSLAKASSAIYYVRPQFADYLEVVQARHPMLDFLCATEPSANTICSSKEYNINIITGPNGSGKSIFVRQIILIQVMAQVGCYVPAHSAILRVSDRILARVYLEDNMDCGASAFVLEMKEIQYFLTVLTNNTLIIIDELCRSTSVEEGTALAMAICERLMKTSAFVFFTTHFKFLAKLQDLHFCVKTWQLETLTETINNQMVLRFTYNVIPGITALEHYGIFLAKASWPETIIKYAEEIVKKSSNSHKRPAPQIERISAAARLKYDLEAELKMFKAKKLLTRAKINEKLLEYQKNLESLGHQVEVSLLVPEPNNNDSGNYNNTIPVNNQNESDYSLEETSGVSFDYFNLKNQNDNNISATSENLNLSLTMQPRNGFENLLSNNKEVSPQFFNIQNNTQETNNCFYSENPFQSFPNQQTYFQNNYSGSFLNYSNDVNNLNQCPEIDATLNFSYSNIFEPEVILETNQELMINFPNVQNSLAQQKRFIFHKESTVGSEKTMLITQENIFMTSHHENLSLPREYSFVSREDSIISFNDDEDVTIFESVGSGSCFKNNTRNNNYLGQDDESFFSVTEQQFSLPLTQHIERTSTPVISQILWNSEDDVNLTNPQPSKINLEAQQLNSTSSHGGEYWKNNSTQTNNKKRKINEQELKSNSTKSESIKWVASNQNLFKTPTTMLGTPKPKAQSDSDGSKLSNPTNNKIKQSNNNNTSSTNNSSSKKASSDSIIWNIEKNNITDSRYYSEADITEVLNDLQSYSEYFSDSQDWDFIDEEVKTKLNQTDQMRSLDDGDTKNEVLETKEKSESVGSSEVNSIKFVSDFKQKENQLDSSGNGLQMDQDIVQENNHSSQWSEDIQRLQYGEEIQKSAFLQRQPESIKNASVPEICQEMTHQFKGSTTDQKMSLHNSFGNINLSQCDAQKVHPTKDIQKLQHGKEILKPVSSERQERENQLDNSRNASPMDQDMGHSSSQWSVQKPHQTKDVQKLEHRKEILKPVSSERQPRENLGSQMDQDMSSSYSQWGAQKPHQYGEEIQKSAYLQRQPKSIKNTPQFESVSETNQEMTRQFKGSQTDQQMSFHSEKMNCFEDINLPHCDLEKFHPTKDIQKLQHGKEILKPVSSEKQQRENQFDNSRNGSPMEQNMGHSSSQWSVQKPHQTKDIQKLHHRKEILKPVSSKRQQKENLLDNSSNCSQMDKDTSNSSSQLGAQKPHQMKDIQKLRYGEEIQKSAYLQRQPKSIKNTSQFENVPETGQKMTRQFKGSDQKMSLHNEKMNSFEDINFSHCDAQKKVHPTKDIQKLQYGKEILKPLSSERRQRENQLDNSRNGSPMDQDMIHSSSQWSAQKRHQTKDIQKLANGEESQKPEYLQRQLESIKKNESVPETGQGVTHQFKGSQTDQKMFLHNEKIYCFEDINLSQCDVQKVQYEKEILKPVSPERQKEYIKERFQLFQSSGQCHCDKETVPSPNGSDLPHMGKSGTQEIEQNYNDHIEDLTSTSQNEGKISNIDLVDNANEDVSAFGHTEEKLPNESYCESDNQETETVQSQSLEPLGDIHLELFSDESIVEESQNQTKKDKFVTLSVDAKYGQKNVSLTTDEYETACNVSSEQDNSIFFNTPCSFEPKSTSTPNNENKKIDINLSQKPKRRRLGYVSNNNNEQFLKDPETTIKPILFNKEASPDIFEEDISRTPSDFESSKNLKSNKQKKPKLFKSKFPKFKPPQKLTKKEIEQDFYEQDKKMLESGGDSSKYLEQILNRPSVRQVQETKHIASIHKISTGGVLVIPAKETKIKTRKRKFITPLKKKSEDFDVTLFSDKNSNKFDEFMNNNNNNTKKVVNVRQDIANQFIESEVVCKTDNKEKDCKIKILQNITLNSVSACTVKKTKTVQYSKEGYSTPNTQHIDNIVDKYLKTEKGNASNSQKYDSSFFDKSTIVLDLDDN